MVDLRRKNDWEGVGRLEEIRADALWISGGVKLEIIYRVFIVGQNDCMIVL